jgi:hypothetical protein
MSLYQWHHRHSVSLSLSLSLLSSLYPCACMRDKRHTALDLQKSDVDLLHSADMNTTSYVNGVLSSAYEADVLKGMSNIYRPCLWT